MKASRDGALHDDVFWQGVPGVDNPQGEECCSVASGASWFPDLKVMSSGAGSFGHVEKDATVDVVNSCDDLEGLYQVSSKVPEL